MTSPSPEGRRLGVPPVATRTFSYACVAPESSVAVWASRSSATMRHLVHTSTPRSGVPRNTELSSLPLQSAFESGGRAYGSCGSAANTPIDPSSSWSRIPRHAASAVMPPPTSRYRKSAIDSDRNHLGQVAAVRSRAALTRWRAPTVVVAAISAVCLVLPAAGAAPPTGARRVAIFYYPWYSTPAKDGGWAHWYVDHDGTPVLSTPYYPTRGLYSSSNAKV